jgi:GTP-binding protein YchF
MLSVGIVGLPNVGKSTLFKALTKKQVDIANFPFCTIEPNVGIVEVPDERLEKIAKISGAPKIIPTAIEFIDIAGLIKGSHKGEGLGNQFLARIRETGAILEIVRAFEDENIMHITGQPQPSEDIETVMLELIFKDLETLQKYYAKVEKNAKTGDKEAVAELALTKNLIDLLEKGQPARNYKPNEKELPFFQMLNLLSAKPILYVFNCASDKPKLGYPAEISPVLEIDLKLEEELSELSYEEARQMRQALPHPKNNLDDLISACYALLGLKTFFTFNESENRAWTIKKGARAPQAAGQIHTDFAKGFIRADVIFWEKLVEAGSWAKAREKGLLRTEGKEYVVKDGDVILFKT